MSEREGSPGEAGPRRPALTAEDILRIAAYRERSPTREAMVIAHTYHRIAADLAGELGRAAGEGAGPAVNNWYCYAVWSSKAVGEGLDLSRDSPFLAEVGSRLRLPGRFRRPFRTFMITLMGPSYQLGLALANRAIFLETGSLAADLWRAEGDYSYKVRTPKPSAGGAEVERRPEFVSALLAEADEGYLDTAATLLTEARGSRDPTRRGELILGASIALSAYEQARAQRLLELVLYRPVRWVTRVWWRWLLSAVTRRPLHRLGLYTAPHEELPWPLRRLEDLWARLFTRFMAYLRTPVSEIRLAKPLRPPPGVDAERVRAPIGDARVRGLVERFVPDSGRATAGVADWLDYHERMRFIVNYFRMYQGVPEMAGPPFAPPASDELDREMAEGEVPEPVFSEWFRKRVERYEARSRRRGVRGFVVRRMYRSPVESDPDAVELARIDLGEYMERRSLTLTAAPE